MSTSIMSMPKPQFFDNSGLPLAGGKIFTYSSGTTTPKATYTDSSGTTANTNPVILDASGRANIWLSGYYTIVCQNSNGVQLWSVDNVSSINASQGTVTNYSEWVAQTVSALTYIGATQFSISGDLRGTFSISRRIQATITAGIIYGTISNSTYASGITTVTVTWDSTTLDAGLSAVALGILSSQTPFSYPPNIKFGVVALTDAASIATDASLGKMFTVTLGGNRTLAAPTNPPPAGWDNMYIWKFTQDSTGSRTITLDPIFTFGSQLTGITLSTGGGKSDYMGAVWNSATSKWNVISFQPGY